MLRLNDRNFYISEGGFGWERKKDDSHYPEGNKTGNHVLHRITVPKTLINIQFNVQIVHLEVISLSAVHLD